MKKVLKVEQSGRGHWVGDGFPVRTMFSPRSHGTMISPFLMLDYAGPAEFPPSDKPRGVEEHPHKGFETVTIVYSGEVAHRDGGTVAGLYAAGRTAVGICSNSYVSGLSLSDCIFSGRRAGEHAATRSLRLRDARGHTVTT